MRSEQNNEPTANRVAKDSVFTDLFSDKRYLLELYQALHPEDTTATRDDLILMTLKSVVAEHIHNDLGFRVGDRLIVPVEAKSTWSPNIVIRLLAIGFRHLTIISPNRTYCSTRTARFIRGGVALGLID